MIRYCTELISWQNSSASPRCFVLVCPKLESTGRHRAFWTGQLPRGSAFSVVYLALHDGLYGSQSKPQEGTSTFVNKLLFYFYHSYELRPSEDMTQVMAHVLAHVRQRLPELLNH
jgi:hypothetical protein